MIYKNNENIGFIYKNNENIDKIYKNNELIFEQGYTREQTGVPPITTTYQAIGKNLKDYRVYGNTVQNGEPTPDTPIEMVSCGDLITDTTDVNYGKYKIPVNVRSDNLATNLEFGWYSGLNQKFSISYDFKRCTAKIKPNTTYTISKKNASNRFVVITSELEIAPNVPYKRVVLAEQNTNRTQYTFTTREDENYLFFGYYRGTNETEIELAEEEIMIVEGSTTPSKYIPYYNETTNIYLDEPLRKIEEYSDYIDFKNQKVFRNVIVNDDTGTQTIENSYTGTTDSSGTSISLPNIPTIKGTTIFEIDTEIQPSSMYIKYKGK